MCSRWCVVFVLLLVKYTNQEMQNADGEQHQGADFLDNPTESVRFETPDFETEYDLNGTSVQLEAYEVSKSRDSHPSNDRKQWVSLGCPYLTENRHGHMVQFDPEGISVFVKMLDVGQKAALSARAKHLYNLDDDISPLDLIRPLPLTGFNCRLRFVHNNEEYSVDGQASDLHKVPFKVMFPLRSGHPNRTALENRMKLIGNDLTLHCELGSIGQREQTASLTITGDQFRLMNLTGRLFGRANRTFVSRPQTVALSDEIMSSLKVEERYDTDATEFNELYIRGLMQISHSTFQPVSFDEALLGLSGYRLPSEFPNETLLMSTVKEGFEKQFLVSTLDGKQLLSACQQDCREASAAINPVATAVMQQFDVDQDRQYVETRGQQWLHSGMTIDQQLAELNGRPATNIYWERAESVIRPRYLKVLLVNRGAMGKTMKLERIKRRPKQVRFRKFYDLELPGGSVSQQQQCDQSTDVRLIVDQTFATKFDPFKADLSVQQQALQTRLQELERKLIRGCRICFQETEGSSQCQGTRSSCSGWSFDNSNTWTLPFRDDTDRRSGGCKYQWIINCK